MKRFLLNLFLFSFIILVIFIIGIFLPPTPRASTSYLFTERTKDSLLANVEAPRIIFVGGSNLSFGLNSQMIMDSLCLNPINTGIQVGLGLIFMMKNVLPYIKSGDIVIVANEYHGYYGDLAYGEDALLRIIMDVDPDDIRLLSIRQLSNLLIYLPKYSFSKLKPTEYLNKYINLKKDIFNSVHSFNKYGDVVTHWGYEPREFPVVASIRGDLNYRLIDEIKYFEKELNKKGAYMFIAYPGFQATSFNNCRNQIKAIEDVLISSGFDVLGEPDEFMVPDSMMFDTPYHLSKEATDNRTNLLIQDLRYSFGKN